MSRVEAPPPRSWMPRLVRVKLLRNLRVAPPAILMCGLLPVSFCKTPRLSSEVMESVPALTVVMPAYVLVLERTRVPLPVLVRPAGVALLLLITPLIVAVLALTWTVRAVVLLRSTGFWKSSVLLALTELRTSVVIAKLVPPHVSGALAPPILTEMGAPKALKPL